MSENNNVKANHAKRFERVRAAHQIEVAEDYVEMIAELIKSDGEARAVVLATRFGVTNATVNKTIARLQRDGLVESRPYRSIFLTEQGKSLAEQSANRHKIVLDFLLSIGINEQTAQIDAEGIEHHVSAETLHALKYLTNNTKPSPAFKAIDWAKMSSAAQHTIK